MLEGNHDNAQTLYMAHVTEAFLNWLVAQTDVRTCSVMYTVNAKKKNKQKQKNRTFSSLHNHSSL